MGGSSSKRSHQKEKVQLNGGASTGRHHDHHYWLSQHYTTGTSGGYSGGPYAIASRLNHHPHRHPNHNGAAPRGPSGSQFYLNEHDSTTSHFASHSPPAGQLYEPLHLSTRLSTATPPTLAPSGLSSCQQLDLNDPYQTSVAGPLGQPAALQPQQACQQAPPPQTTPAIYEDADLYLEHGLHHHHHNHHHHNNSNSNHRPHHQRQDHYDQHQPVYGDGIADNGGGGGGAFCSGGASSSASNLHLNRAGALQALSQQHAIRHAPHHQANFENPFTCKPNLGHLSTCNDGGGAVSQRNEFNETGQRPLTAKYANLQDRHSQQQQQRIYAYQEPQLASKQKPHHQQQQAGRRRKLVVAQHRRAHHERGLAMSEDDRRRASQLGLLPPAVQDQELQSRAVLNFIDNCQDELAKYMYLRNLKDFNENLFYFTLTNNVEKLMPLVYTPTVGLACQKFSEIYMRPRGLFVSANDLGRVRQLIANWPEKDVRVIVVTDGERILGLGDLGANGMGISIGKLSLYTALAGIPPQNVLPVTIDVGTNNEKNLKDPFYIGLRQPRIRGDKYEQLIEEFMQAVVERWGRSCLIQFEDFANTTAFTLLERYRHDYCTFNDDIQGTASVSLSGLITAARLTGKRLGDCSFLFYGAGEANLGTAQLLIMAMQDDGLTRDEAKRRIYLVDSKGLVVRSRQDLNGHKLHFAQEGEHLRELEAIVDHVKPSALIGASAQGGSFSESICRKMAQYNERPIIFALSNPTSKAECTAAQAYQWTGARCVFASGSPFEPVQLDGKTYITGQGNNAYIFPGVGLAAIAAHTHTVPEQIFLVAARALSDQVTKDDIEVGLVYPSLTKIREVTLRVATRCLEHFYAERLANCQPEPNDKEQFLKTIQYDPRY